jgi:hypothetical protein
MLVIAVKALHVVTYSVGYNHGTPRTPMPKLAKNRKKNETVTIPSLYELPPASVRPCEMAIMIQQKEHAAAETIIT